MDHGSPTGKLLQRLPGDHERCEAMLGGSAITLAACDARQRYVWLLNPPRGFTAEQLVGRSLGEVLPAEHVAEIVEFHEKVLTSARGERREIRVVVSDEVRYYDVTAKPVMDGSGRVAGLTLAAVEVTGLRRVGIEEHLALERERAARLAAEARCREAERQIVSRSKLMRGFSHEVRNPLSAALGYVELVLAGVKGELTEAQRFFLSRARRSLDTAVGSLDDLLMLARAEAGGLTVHLAPTDLCAMLRDVAEWNREQAQAAGLELRLEVPDTLPVIETDAVRVRQVIGNLLSNALKFTKCGAVGIRASHGECADAPGPGPWIMVDVWDTGPGIPEEAGERIFEEFTRLKSGAAGFGLGLAVSRMLARALGGEVTLQSRVGVGSTFTLWLPAVTPGRAGRG